MIYNSDKWLKPFKKQIVDWHRRLLVKRDEIAGYGKPLNNSINNYLYYGVHRESNKWIFRELAPYSIAIYILCYNTF